MKTRWRLRNASCWRKPATLPVNGSTSGNYVVGGNRGIATGYLYLALDAVPVAEPDADDLENQELLLPQPR